MTIYLVVLKYDIVFHDADEGECFAGQGQRILDAYCSEKKARRFVERWSPVLAEAEKETIVFPRQHYNSQLYKALGFDLNCMEWDSRNFVLGVEPIELDEELEDA